MTRFRSLAFGLIAACAALALFVAPRPARSSISVLSQVSNVAVTVYVSTTPAPTAVPSAEAGGSEEINLAVGATSAQYIQPNATNLTFVGNAGQTVTQSCAEEIWVSPTQGDSSIDIGLDSAFTLLGGTASIPTSDIQYQGSTLSIGTAWTSAVDFGTDGNTWALLTTLTSNEAPICLNLRINIPSSATAGVYYATLSLPFYTYNGVPGTPPSASPSPTPSATPVPTPSGYVYTVFGNSTDFSTGFMEAFNANSNGNIAPAYTITSSLTAPAAVATDSTGNVYVSNQGGVSGTGYIYVFGPAPSMSLIGTLSLLGTAVNEQPNALAFDGSGNLYVAGVPSAVQEFAAGSWLTGNPAQPLLTLSVGTTPDLTYPEDVAVSSDGTMYVANYSTSSGGSDATPGGILVFAPGSTGTANPSAVIAGTTSDIGNPAAVALDAQDNIYVLTSDAYTNARVLVFAAGSNGDVAPIADITGSKTLLSAQSPGSPGLAVTQLGGVFVYNGTSPGAVLYFPPGSNGNVTPLYDITGSNTGFLNSDGYMGVGL